MSSALLTAFTTVYLYLKNADTYIAFAKVCSETTLLILAITLAVYIEYANRPEYRIHRNSADVRHVENCFVDLPRKPVHQFHVLHCLFALRCSFHVENKPLWSWRRWLISSITLQDR